MPCSVRPKLRTQYSVLLIYVECVKLSFTVQLAMPSTTLNLHFLLETAPKEGITCHMCIPIWDMRYHFDLWSHNQMALLLSVQVREKCRYVIWAREKVLYHHAEVVPASGVSTILTMWLVVVMAMKLMKPSIASWTVKDNFTHSTEIVNQTPLVLSWVWGQDYHTHE